MEPLVENRIVHAAILFLYRKSYGLYLEPFQPVPEPNKIDLHLLVEGFACRIDICPTIRLYVEKMLHIEEREAENEIVGIICDFLSIDISFFIVGFNNLLLPFSRLIP